MKRGGQVDACCCFANTAFLVCYRNNLGQGSISR
jgi:hypothetical protein